MEERPDLERFVDEETAAMLSRRARFLGWPTALRIAVTLAAATGLILPTAGLLVLLGRRDEEGPVAAIVIGAVLALLVYVAAVYYAVHPVRATRAALRSSGGYPTSAPGYGVPRQGGAGPKEGDSRG